jgi:hypothetical protein
VVDVATAVLVGIAATIIGWNRLPDIARDTIWAEDSRLFLQERIVFGPWATLVRPYDGYQHLVPRILTDVAVLLSPIEDYARTVTLLAVVMVGAVAATTYAVTGGVVRTRPARIGLALIPVLLPLVPVEALGNFANLHWFALYLTPFALLHRPTTRTRSALLAVVALAIAGTEIQAVVFVPLLVGMVRWRRAWAAGIAFLVGLAAQFISFALDPRVRAPRPDIELVDAVKAFLIEPVMSVFVPDPSVAAERLLASGTVVAAALAVPFAIAAIVAVAGRWSRPSLLAVVLVYGAGVVWFVDVLLNPNDQIAFSVHGLGWVGTVGFVRYALVPSMFLLAIVVMAADRLLGVRTRRRSLRLGGRVLGICVMAGLLATVLAAFVPYTTGRSDGPRWTDSVRDNEATCASEPGSAQEKLSGAPVHWGVVLSCKDIDGDARFP